MSGSKIPNYTPPREIKVRGATASDGDPYVRVTASGKKPWIPRYAFIGSGGEALRLLKAAGVPLLGEEWTNTKALVAKIEHYPRKALISRSGWDDGGDFALPSGDVIATSPRKSPVVLFDRDPHKCATSGTIRYWRETTALLKDQPIAAFVMFAAFAAPFLSLTNYATNPGFELAGPSGVGKSTVQRLAAAVCGPADSPSGVNYWMTANATINAMEQVMSAHNDMPLIIDEANLYASTDNFAARARKFNALVFALAEGSEKRRYGSGQSQRSRFVFITSTNEPLAELLAGHRVAVAEAAADRLFTIPIGADRPYGIFDHLPLDRADIGSLAEELSHRIRQCYGVGMRQFLARLVVERAKDPEAVAGRLRELMNFFRNEVQVDCNDGSETRAADAFGLVYAAAKFAIDYGAVSKKLDPLGAALTCYRLNRASRAKPANPAKQLLNLAQDWDILEVRPDRLAELSDAEIDEASGIVRIARNGKKELLLTESQLHRLTDNRSRFLADPDICRMMIAERGRAQTKRQVRSNRGPERFFCFRLPEDLD